MNSQLAQEYNLNKFGLKIVNIETSFKINVQWLIKIKTSFQFIFFLCINTMKNKKNFSRVPINEKLPCSTVIRVYAIKSYSTHIPTVGLFTSYYYYYSSLF